MKRTILAILILVLAVALAAQTLPLDSRRKEMQFARSFTPLRYAPAADTLWRSLTLPARTVEVVIIGGTGSLGVGLDSLYVVGTVGHKAYVDIPAGAAFSFPAIGLAKIWIRRTAAGTASIANIIYKRM